MTAIVMLALLCAGPALAGGLQPPLGMLARGLIPAPLLERPELFAAFQPTKGGGEVMVLIRTVAQPRAAGELAAELESLAVQVQSVAGPVVAAVVPLDMLEDLADHPSVDQVELAWPLEAYLDVSAPLVGATQTWDELGDRGQGVVVGVVDSGLAWDHRDFVNSEDNTSRLRWLWDVTPQSGSQGEPPPEWGFGIEWTRDELSAAVQAGDRSLIDTWDPVGHGTHVMGIAAGNGQATGNDYPAGRYVGIAPAAELIAVKTTLLPPFVIEGVRYVFQRADELGMPAAVNLSLGTHLGPHDGTAGLDLALDALVGPGHVIVAAAGNENNRGWHAETKPAQGQTGLVTLNVVEHAPDDLLPDIVALAAYAPIDNAYTVTVTSPGGASVTVGPGQPGEYIGESGMWIVDNGFLSKPDELSGTTMVLIALVGNPLGGATRNLLEPGVWRIEFCADSAPADEIVHMWMMNAVIGGSMGSGAAFADGRQERMLIGSPASANRLLAVGAYYSKFEWTLPGGSPGGYGGSNELGDIAWFSSPGPTRDGRIKPDFSAPGYGVAAAISEGSDIAGDYPSHIVEDGQHIVLQGTSMASPHVTGAAALLLQRYPLATPEEIRELLQIGAMADQYTGELPNNSWGWGKINVYDSLSAPDDDDDDDDDDAVDDDDDDDDAGCCG